MKTQDFAKQIVDFNKNAAKMGFDTISAFSGQAAKLTNSLIGMVPNVPEEGKKATAQLFDEQQKSLNNLQGFVEGQLDLDWTSQDTPAKSFAALEQFSKQAFAQVDDIKKESQGLAAKATEQLPKEAKPLVDFWNDAINNGFTQFQDTLNKSIEISKELLATASVVTTDAKAKATSKNR